MNEEFYKKYGRKVTGIKSYAQFYDSITLKIEKKNNFLEIFKQI